MLVDVVFSETDLPIRTKLHVEHPWEEGTKVYVNSLGRKTKKAAMAINSRIQ